MGRNKKAYIAICRIIEIIIQQCLVKAMTIKVLKECGKILDPQGHPDLNQDRPDLDQDHLIIVDLIINPIIKNGEVHICLKNKKNIMRELQIQEDSLIFVLFCIQDQKNLKTMKKCKTFLNRYNSIGMNVQKCLTQQH